MQSVTYKHLLTFPSSYCGKRSQRYFRLLIHLRRVFGFVLLGFFLLPNHF